MSVLRVGLVFILAVAATVAANVVLLGVATGSSEPVGKLTPRAELIPSSSPRRPVQTAPSQTRPQVEPGERADD
jgi:hypothetical protein